MALLNAGDPSGLAEIFRAARSPDPDIFKLAETAVLKKVLVWDDTHPLAGKIDHRDCRVPRFPMGKPEIEALAALLDAAYNRGSGSGEGGSRWTARRAVIFLLGLSGRPEAVTPLLVALRHEETRKDHQGRNRNRLIGALGVLRCREAVPDIVEYLGRGEGSAYAREWGDRAEQFAAQALGRIAAPESVEPLIALLDSTKTAVRDSALEVLTRIFKEDVPDGFRLMPAKARLRAARIGELPDPKQLHAAWEKFWRVSRTRYSWDPDSPALREVAGGSTR
jgi:HEAT repeat protein